MNKSQQIASGLFIIVFVWILSGVMSEASRTPPTCDGNCPSDKVVIAVQIQHIVAVQKKRTITLYGVTESSRRVDIKAETEGKVLEIAAVEGSYVKKGEIILKIETRDRAARFDEARAVVRQREIELDVSRKLSKKGFQAETSLAASEASLQSAKANLIRAGIDLENTLIKAPFDGILEEVNVEVGALVGPNIRTGQGSFNDGDTIATIVDNEPFLVIGNVSERYVKDLQAGISGSVHLITGETLNGKIIFVGAVADPLTRTFRVEMEIHSNNVTSGITASMTLPIGTEIAHHIPSSALSLNENGILGVKTLEKENTSDNTGIVKFFHVEIFESDSTGIWVTGLPKNINLITVGHPFVKDGDTASGVS